jgi:hypothetical protein
MRQGAGDQERFGMSRLEFVAVSDFPALKVLRVKVLLVLVAGIKIVERTFSIIP